ncbi:thiolase family protein [Ramlibacter sp. AN1015]|uniref:thiolase C-terminal domain-containing protein n=1 Tax=Ramlibacter sp. AN1015 TaxID=3133428 RepID=UPI0030C32190
MNLRDKAVVSGVGETRYVRAPGSGKTPISLQLEAALAAIADAGLKPTDIDGLIPFAIGPLVAEDFITNFGIPDLSFSALTPLGGASATASLQCAAAVIASGVCRHVLLSLGRNGYSGTRITSRIAAMPQFRVVGEFEVPTGAVAPVQFYAPIARRHMELYGTTSRQLGEIAVTMRRHALLNDNAVMTEPLTLEEHQAARMISDPLRLFDCSLESDGAACVVVSAADHAKDMPKRPVFISGVGEGHPESPSAVSQRADLLAFGTHKAARKAFHMAGVQPADIDVAEIYDCFTFIVLRQLEELGFCAAGEGGAFVQDGGIALGGRLPVNTHGGLLSQAHVGGMNHIVELVRQLRGEAGRAQVQGAELGLVTGFGDMCDGSVAIMRRG